MNAPAKILAALRASGLGVSGTELCQQLGVSRAAVWAHIESLRAAGFEIVASPHRGYQLVKSPDALLADDLTSRLGNVSVIGRKIIVLSETTSTNDEIEKAAHANRDEGLVVFAESQTQGRGRRGRSWSSPAGKGLWFSILLRPQLAPDECTQLTVATATAHPSAENIVKTFSRLTRSNTTSALTALYAYESQQPEVSRLKSDGLRQHYGIEEPATLAYFEVHAETDIRHRSGEREALGRCLSAGASAELVLDSAGEALDAYWQLLDGICDEAGVRLTF